jgi:hypothetical protein
MTEIDDDCVGLIDDVMCEGCVCVCVCVCVGADKEHSPSECYNKFKMKLCCGQLQ